MTIPRLLEMSEYWGRNPPIHEMLAAFFQVKDAGASKAVPAVEDAMGSFLQDFAAAGGVVSTDLGDVSV